MTSSREGSNDDDDEEEEEEATTATATRAARGRAEDRNDDLLPRFVFADDDDRIAERRTGPPPVATSPVAVAIARVVRVRGSLGSERERGCDPPRGARRVRASRARGSAASSHQG
eukprot:31402-Pelagococcus_subviridis.AAC.4